MKINPHVELKLNGTIFSFKDTLLWTYILGEVLYFHQVPGSVLSGGIRTSIPGIGEDPDRLPAQLATRQNQRLK